MTESYPIPAPTPEQWDTLRAFAAALTHPDLIIHDDPQFARRQCELCGDPGHLTVARIYGDPRPSEADSFTGPLDACAWCTPDIVDEALQARRDDAVIVVEVQP